MGFLTPRPAPSSTNAERNLTPEDIVVEQFPTVRFREGYNVDVVDDFLDEVVTAWRRDKARIAELETALLRPVVVLDAPTE